MMKAGLIEATRHNRMRNIAVLSGIAMCAGAIAYGDKAEKRIETHASAADCKFWDEEAAGGIGALLGDPSGAAEVRLNEALAQLRRARLFCRSGSVSVARHDYESLHRAFPIMTGSIPHRPAAVKEATTKMSLPR